MTRSSPTAQQRTAFVYAQLQVVAVPEGLQSDSGRRGRLEPINSARQARQLSQAGPTHGSHWCNGDGSATDGGVGRVSL